MPDPEMWTLSDPGFRTFIVSKINQALDMLVQLLAAQNDLRQQVQSIKSQEDTVMADLTVLTAAVTENTSVDESAIVLLNQLAGLIVGNLTDPVALQALADQLTAESANLAAAVVQNTPVVPPAV